MASFPAFNAIKHVTKAEDVLESEFEEVRRWYSWRCLLSNGFYRGR